MSIWCSFGIFDSDGEAGEPGPPIRYRRSHVLPDHDHDRAGHLDLGYIPGFITRDGRDAGPEDREQVWPYLRLGVSADDVDRVDVVLDHDQVEHLRDQLTWWLDRVSEVHR